MIKHTFILLLLGLLKALVEPSKGKSARLKLSVSYHKSPATFYNGHPVQVSCSSLHSPRGAMELEVSSFRGGSKNRSVAVEGKYVVNGKLAVRRDMDKMVTLFLPGESLPLLSLLWMQLLPLLPLVLQRLIKGNSTNAKLLNDSAVFKFCTSPIFFFGGVIRCTAVDPLKKPFRYTLEREFNFKYKPMKPLLKIYYHLTRNIAIEGETLLVSCSAHVGSTGRLILTSGSGNLHPSWTLDWDSLPFENSFGHVTLLKEMTTEGPRISAMFHFSTILPLNGSLFECHSTDIPQNASRNTHGVSYTKKASHPLFVKAYPYRPQLSISSVLSDRITLDPYKETWILDGTCRTPRTYAQHLGMVFRAGHVTSVVFRVTNGSTLRSQRKTFEKGGNGPRTQTVYKVDFWIVQQKGGTVSGNLKAYLSPEIKWVTVSCTVRDLQRCQHFRSSRAVRKMAFSIDCAPGASKEPLAFTLVKSGAAIVLILCACLFIFVVVAEFIRKLVD